MHFVGHRCLLKPLLISVNLLGKPNNSKRPVHKSANDPLEYYFAQCMNVEHEDIQVFTVCG